MNKDIDNPEPTNWVGRWAKKIREQEDKRVYKEGVEIDKAARKIYDYIGAYETIRLPDKELKAVFVGITDEVITIIKTLNNINTNK